MGFWLYCLGMNLLVPGVMIFFGWRFLKKPPAKINSFYGYRTTRSMQSQRAWDLAHQVCGRVWRAAGLALVPVTLVVYCLLLGQTVKQIGIWCIVLTIVQLTLLLGTIVPVELALKHMLDDYEEKR